MPVRNGEETVSMALKSTLLALGPDDELLLGLHNCNDQTESIARDIALREPRLKIHEVAAASFSGALNELLALAKGQLIARMDSDDICLPWRFLIQKRVFARGELDLSFGTAIVGIPLGRLRVFFPQYPTALNQANIESLLRGINPLVHPSMTGRAQSLRLLGGYRETAGEDLDLWLRACNAGMKLGREPAPLIVYNLSPSQLSREVSYVEGWKDSASIREQRHELSSRLGARGLSVREKLEILGLPIPSNWRRLKDFWQ